MRMSVLPWKDVAWFASGVIAGITAGAALSRHRRRAEDPTAGGEVTLPGDGPGHRRIEAAPPEPVAEPVRRTGTAKVVHSGVQGLTKKQLYLEAKKRNIRGRSLMSKEELQRALG